MRKLLTSPQHRAYRLKVLCWLAPAIFFFWASGGVTAQTGLTLYNMPFVPSAHYANPANTPLSKVYVSLPGLSGGAFQLQNNLASLKDVGVSFSELLNDPDLLDREGGQILDKLVSMSQIRNQYLASAEANLFGIGIRAKRHFFSFSVQDRFSSYGNVPEDFIRLLDAEDSNFEETGLELNLSGFEAMAMHYRPFSLGYAYDILPNLTVGVRASYLSGLGYAHLRSDNLLITTNGSTLGFEAANSLLLTTSTWFQENTDFDAEEYLLRPANNGWAFGGGLRYLLEKERIELLMSVSDVGFIHWKEKVHTGVYDQAFLKGETDLYESFDRLFTNVQSAPSETFKTRLSSNFHFGANYYFQGPSSVGFLVRTSNMESTLKTSFAMTFNTMVEKWLGFSMGYNTNGASHNLGAGIAVNLGPVQWHLVSDNVLFFASAGGARQAQFGTGINLVFGAKSREEPWWQPGVVQAPLPGTETDSTFLRITQGPKEEVFVDTTTVEDPLFESGIPAQVEEVEPEPITREEETPPILPRAYFATSDVPLYAEPDADSDVLAIVCFGDSIIIQSDFLHFWEKVEFKGQTGYLKSVFLATAEEWGAIPVGTATDYVTSIKNDDSPARGNYKMTQATSLRLGPSHTTGVILRLFEGYEVELLEKTNDLWWKVRYRGESGYAKAALMENIGKEAFPKEPETVKEELPTGTAPAQAGETPGGTLAGQLYYLTKATSLREKPTGGAAVIVRFKPGDAIKVLEEVNEWWWKVDFKGKIGYAKAQLMSKDKP